MLIFDKVNVSTLDDIKIEVSEISNAKYDTEKGELKWEFTIEPKEKKNFKLKYLVKYPKYKNLIIE